MTEVVYQATLIRPRDICVDPTISCNDITVAYRHDNGFTKIAKAMIERGFPDGRIVVTEAKVKPEVALRFEFESIAALAARHVEVAIPVSAVAERTTREAPLVVSPMQREALALIIAADYKRWENLHGKSKNFMVREGWVVIEDRKPALTAKGQAIAASVGITG